MLQSSHGHFISFSQVKRFIGGNDSVPCAIAQEQLVPVKFSLAKGAFKN
jgi:hypothetical protein